MYVHTHKNKGKPAHTRARGEKTAVPYRVHLLVHVSWCIVKECRLGAAGDTWYLGHMTALSPSSMIPILARLSSFSRLTTAPGSSMIT